jgi:4-carboxymuconolactone decarboxylase
MRAMLAVAALIGSHAVAEFRVMAGGALNVGVTPVELKEIVYQSVAYVGMGKAFDFVRVTNELLASRGVALPLPGQSTTTRETRFEKGLAAQNAIFGASIDRMYEQAPRDQQHIQRLLSANCFGDYYTRGGLDLKQRELVTLSILIALGGTEPQIKGHVQGNVNVGNDRSVLVAVMTALLPWVGYPRTLTALKCVDEIAPAAKGDGHE